MKHRFLLPGFALCLMLVGLASPVGAWTVASNNIPLDSPVYGWLDKLAGFGLVKNDMRGIRPFTRAEAARLLLEQQLCNSALELIVAALLATAADRAGLAAPVELREAGVWVFGDALPKGLLNQDAAALLMRGISLAQSPAVPENLVRELAADVEDFCAGSV